MYILEKEGDEGSDHIYLKGVVKGLVSQKEEIEKFATKIEFTIGALPISSEELESLKEMDDLDEELDIEPSKPEKIYAEHLSEFGDVSLPPPSYIALLEFCLEEEKELESLDMDDEHYTMAYCKYVTGSQWLRQSFREKSLSKKKFPSKNPRDFARGWDKAINKLKGYQKLEKNREEVMAKNLNRFSKRGSIFALVEVERLKGVVKSLKSLGWDIDRKVSI